MKRLFSLSGALAGALAVVLTMFTAATPAYAADEPDAFDALRTKFTDMAVGGDYDPDSPALQPMLDSINDTAQLYWDKMNKSPVSNAIKGHYRDANDQEIPGLDASQDYIFEEYPLGRRRPSSTVYINANSIHFTFQYLRAMATAYATEGTDLYHNQEMLADIKSAIKFVYENHFNPGITRYGNWFSWQLGGPIYLGETLMLLYDELTEQEITDYSTAMIHFLGKAAFTGANATWASRVRMYTGILLKDNDWLTYVQNYMPGVLKYSTQLDGYYLDGTFIQHDTITYNGGYGLMALTDSAFILHMLAGSQWALPEENTDIVYKWVYDSYEPFVYRGLAMDAFRGREITRYDTTQPRGGLIIANAILMLAASAPEGIANDFRSMVKTWFYDNDLMIDEMNNGADTPWYKFPLDTAVKVNNIVNDPTINSRDLSAKNFQMNAGARAIHWRGTWTYTVAMTSKRISNCEIGDSNARGWYTGLGMTHLYNNDLGRYEGVNKATIDWYRLPGTTSAYGRSVSSQTKNQKSFVGGTTLTAPNSQFGATGMDLVISPNNLKMKKSWFQFDDEIVALGSDISGTGTIETTLENYMLDEDNRNFSINGKRQTMAMDGVVADYSDVKTLHIEGNVPGSDIGFYLPSGTDLKAKSENRTGKWSDLGEYNTDDTEQNADFFTIWIPHGQNATNADYAYVLLPGKSVAETSSYASGSDIEILRQDSSAHIVRERTLGLVGANFWNDGNNRIELPGSPNFVTVDRAASVMVREDDNRLDISVADSTQENDGFINVEINRAARGVLALADGMEVLETSPSIKLRINVNKSAGKPFEASFSYEPVALGSTEITSTKLVDGALEVTLKTVPGASSYNVQLGTEPGIYTRTVNSKSNVVPIYGLQPGATYYLAATAKDAFEESELSPEVSFPVPLTMEFVDEYEDFSRLLAYSAGWEPDAGNPNNFAGDITRIKRKAQTVEWFTYMLPDLQNFELETYGYRNSIGDIKLYTSEDGESWTLQPYKKLNTGATEWFRELLTPDGAVNANANYLKVELNSHPERVWAPQFTKFRATMKNTSDVVTVRDPLLNDSRTYETAGIEFRANDDPEKYGGDSDIAVATGEGVDDNWLTYSYTSIDELTLVYSAANAADVRVASSKDGEIWEVLTSATPPVTSNPPGDLPRHTATFTPPEGTNFVKVFAAKDSVLSDMTLKYRPDNSPIQKIRFADSRIDGVIGYDQIPLLKKAPANGISEIEYNVGDDKVMSYNGGTLKFLSQGRTEAVATIVDTDVSATLPVTVYKDLALRRPVTASSAHPSYVASNATNGDLLVTRWQSNTNLDEWLQVDLGSTQVFDSIDIKWYSNGADYDILVSNNGTSWTTVKEVRGAGAGDYVRFDFSEPLTARYVKVQGITESQYSLFSMRALQRTGSDDAEIESRNLALGKPATASANDPNSSSLTPDKAVDGNTGTRWASGRNNDQWFIVNLGEAAEVDGINILWEGAAGKEYKIQISSDGENWTDMVHEKNNSGAGWQRYTLENKFTGQYVRMLGISRVNQQYGYSMFEFEVMGVMRSDKEVQPFESISLNPAETSLLNGQTERLTANTTPKVNAISVGWKSSAPEVVSVSDTGVIRARAASGSAVITAYSVLDPEIKAESTVTITPYVGSPVKVESISITGTPTEVVYPRDEVALSAVVLPEDATNTGVSWKSSDPSVAIVNAGGVVKAVGPGVATITATSVSSGLKDSVDIAVSDAIIYEPEVVVSPAVVVEGVAFAVKGSGFAPGEDVLIKVGDAEAVTVKVDLAGDFRKALTAPVGTHEVVAIGAVSAVEARSSVTVTAPNYEPSISVNPDSVAPNGAFAVKGTGFAPFEDVTLSVAAGGEDVSVPVVVAADAAGEFSRALNAPTATGPIEVKALGAVSAKEAKALVAVVAPVYEPSIVVDAASVSPGGAFLIRGSGFAAGEDVSVVVGSAAPVSVKADAAGKFTRTLNAPADTGSHEVVAVGSVSAVEAKASVTVTADTYDPAINVDPATVVDGVAFAVKGTGFAPGENVTIKVGDAAPVTVKADAAGKFTKALTAPVGNHQVVARGAVSAKDVTASVTVTGVEYSPSVELPESVTVGEVFAVKGTGFAPGEDVSVVVGSAAPVIVKADAAGRFSKAFDAPAEPGTVEISAKGAVSGVEVTASVLVEEGQQPPKDLKVVRHSGATRYETSLELLKSATTGAPVFVATGNGFADALSAAPAAALEGGRVVLTHPRNVDADLVAQIRALAPKNIYIVGGTVAVSSSVENALVAIDGVEVTRLSGASRYETSLAIYDEFFAGRDLTDVFVATGRSFPDALAASAAAGALQAPVVLVDGKSTSVPVEVTNRLVADKVDLTLIAGGTGAISKGVEDALAAKVGEVFRLSGANRLATSVAINAWVDSQLDTAVVRDVYVATASSYPDALSAAAPAGDEAARLVLSSKDCMPKAAVEAINSYTALETLHLVGGKNALTDNVGKLNQCK